ncbi:MAG: glycosyltransferase family 4 protein [Chromatiales bacterium]|jgi:glycosyltransferase involved in cell wall biosynthesis|nr:glycosyltransferase family 4 protein [Chromatiales bacterium]
MKIAQVAPLFESVPPKTYGGTERVVHFLTEELIRQGHEVVLYASADSRTSAELRPVVPQSLRLSGQAQDNFTGQLLQLAAVARAAHSFDVIHFHTDFLHFPLCRHIAVPQVSTMHGRLDLPELKMIFAEFSDMPVISISNDQRRPLPGARWSSTVYNGMPEQLYDFQPQQGKYLAFLGRISPEKGPEEAINIALRTGLPLRMAAKVDAADREYFEQRIRPLLREPNIEFLGEIDDRGKNELLGGALALLFPVSWPEPFGLAMVEALACGTPVIAYQRGSVPEVMLHGHTGYIVDNQDQAVSALSDIERIDRRACRRHFEENFSARKMADGYLAAYRLLIEGSAANSSSASPEWNRTSHAAITAAGASRA